MAFNITIKDCVSNNPLSGASIGTTGDYKTNNQGQINFADCDDLSACAGNNSLSVSGKTNIAASGATINTALFEVYSFGLKPTITLTTGNTASWTPNTNSLSRSSVRPSSSTIYNAVAIPENATTSIKTYTLTATCNGVSASDQITQAAATRELYWNDNHQTTLSETGLTYESGVYAYAFTSKLNGVHKDITLVGNAPSGVSVSINQQQEQVSVTLPINTKYDGTKTTTLNFKQVDSANITLQLNLTQAVLPTTDVAILLPNPPGNIDLVASTNVEDGQGNYNEVSRTDQPMNQSHQNDILKEIDDGGTTTTYLYVTWVNYSGTLTIDIDGTEYTGQSSGQDWYPLPNNCSTIIIR